MLTPSTQHYVTFFLAMGKAVPETYEMRIPERKLPAQNMFYEAVYAYQYHDISVVNIGGEELSGEPKNLSPKYYLGLAVKTIEEYEKGISDPLGKAGILQAKVEGVTHLMQTVDGLWMTMPPDTEVVTDLDGTELWRKPAQAA